MDLKRAEELRQQVVKSGKVYEIFYFASADKIREFTPARMAEMGSNLVWIGRESCLTEQRKNQGIDLKALVEELQLHGIKVVVSTMLMMDQHTRQNIWPDLEDHLLLRPDFSMFTYMIGLPGTPLYDRFKKEDRLLRSMTYEDWNGVGTAYHKHPHFNPTEGRELREQVLKREFRQLGPSVLRLIQTDLKGYLYLKSSESEALRLRAHYLAAKMSNNKAVLWSMARLVPPEMRGMVEDTLASVERHFGPTTLFEKAEGAVLWGFGTKQKLRYRLLGDVIQPATTVTRYPGLNGA